MAREWCERWDCDSEEIYEWMLEQCKRDEFNCIDCPYFVEKEIDSLDDLL